MYQVRFSDLAGVDTVALELRRFVEMRFGRRGASSTSTSASVAVPRATGGVGVEDGAGGSGGGRGSEPMHLSPALCASLGLPPPQGILLLGGPGVGKTSLALAAAGWCEVNVIPVLAPSIRARVVGDAEAALAAVFATARQSAPCVSCAMRIYANSRSRRPLGSTPTHLFFICFSFLRRGPQVLVVDQIEALAGRRDASDETFGGSQDRVVACFTSLVDACFASGDEVRITC